MACLQDLKNKLAEKSLDNVHEWQPQPYFSSILANYPIFMRQVIENLANLQPTDLSYGYGFG